MAALGSYILLYIVYSLSKEKFPDKTTFCDMYHTLKIGEILSFIRGEDSRKFQSIRIFRRND
jgi:hypothetical protein